MADYVTKFTLNLYKADELIKEYTTAERFEDCFNYMLMMDDTEPFQYYEIKEERIDPSGKVIGESRSHFTKCADDIDEIYF
ncbi:MAG: hypothetical protein IKD83_06735 [Firmicutes bacterium]|nr:hypothetical protein [Bacillota bacterium]MBQ7241339.1 hypothetical protein [Bacillota bacterium]MBR2594299.1 hypothetical protein [Bacillota bacterium]